MADTQTPIVDPETAKFLGLIATICFSLQYLPQTYLNWKRKSVVGFSAPAIVLKLFGGCFLFINAWVTGEAYPVVLYGLCNTVQHSYFMFQFFWYKKETNSTKYLLFLAFPLIPIFLWLTIPSSIVYTNSFKPISQVISHFPQLVLCYQKKTTSGVSMHSQHLNFTGGLAGLIMCFVLTPKANTTYLLYFNSIFQALSLYYFAAIYDGVAAIFGCEKRDNLIDLNKYSLKTPNGKSDV